MLKFSFLFFFNLSSVFACSLQKDTISLSASMTSQLFFMGLQNDPKLLAISQFYPLGEDKFEKKRISGGIYLPIKELQWVEKETLLYLDSSAELEKIATQMPNLNPKIKVVVVSTRRKRSWEVVTELNQILKNETKGCEKVINKLEDRSRVYQQKIRETKERKTIFFFGEIKKNSPLPGKVIIDDLFVGDLLSMGKLKTYPASGGYVDWSHKILASLDGYERLGVTDQVSSATTQNNLSSLKIFIPGLDQFNLSWHHF